MTKNEKISRSLKDRFANEQHHLLGKRFRPKTDEEKANLSEKSKAAWTLRGRQTQQEKNAKNVASVVAYRARRQKAILPDTDLKLIQRIYLACPAEYHVDHITALAVGGPHHQDNLQYLPGSENCRKGKSFKYNKALVIRWQDVLNS